MSVEDFTYFIKTINNENEILKLYQKFGNILLEEKIYKEILQAINKVDPENSYINMQQLYLRLYEISKDPEFLITSLKYIPGQLIDKCDIIEIFQAIDLMINKKTETIKKMLYVCCGHFYLYKIFHKHFDKQMPDITKQILEENQNLYRTVDNLEKQILELKYAPGGIGYELAKKEFENLTNL